MAETTVSGTIRVSIPASVAANVKTLKTSLKSLAEKLGCPKCFSGADCFFQLQRRYLIDEKATVLTHSMAVGDVIPANSRSKSVFVNLSTKASFNLDTILLSVDKIAELTGHVACATGCNLFFRRFINELDVMDVSDAGKVARFNPSR